jgi:hypothetical protein
MKDADLLAGFERSTLNQFPHEYHVRVAYLLILKYGQEEAFDHMVAGIKGLASRFGTSPSFIHITRTAAWIKIIGSQVDIPLPSGEFLDNHPDLLRKDLLEDYYNWGRLLTPRSRRTFVEPNRPFPTSPGELKAPRLTSPPNRR